MQPVWEIGSPVWGVHTEVDNNVFTIFVIKEKIIKFYEDGGWKSAGKINGVTVYSEMLNGAYDFYEKAIEYADGLAKEAEEMMVHPCGWTKVVKKYDKQ